MMFSLIVRMRMGRALPNGRSAKPTGRGEREQDRGAVQGLDDGGSLVEWGSRSDERAAV